MEKRELAYRELAEKLGVDISTQELLEEFMEEGNYFETDVELFDYVYLDEEKNPQALTEIALKLSSITPEELKGYDSVAEMMVINIDWTHKTKHGYIYLNG